MIISGPNIFRVKCRQISEIRLNMSYEITNSLDRVVFNSVLKVIRQLPSFGFGYWGLMQWLSSLNCEKLVWFWF